MIPIFFFVYHFPITVCCKFNGIMKDLLKTIIHDQHADSFRI